jgi:uncharacterized protein YjbJ (UPF0337 family)
MTPFYISIPETNRVITAKDPLWTRIVSAEPSKTSASKVEESFGRTTRDAKIHAEGIAQQVSETAQDMYSHARDAASNMSDTVGDTALSLEKLLRRTIETQPYTSGFVALGIGWLLGRMHRPL